MRVGCLRVSCGKSYPRHDTARQLHRSIHVVTYTSVEQCSVSSRRVRVPGFEPGISPPQGEVLTTILHTPGEAGCRSLYLSHAKRALYHLSYIPDYHWCTRTQIQTPHYASARRRHAAPHPSQASAASMHLYGALRLIYKRLHSYELNPRCTWPSDFTAHRSGKEGVCITRISAQS